MRLASKITKVFLALLVFLFLFVYVFDVPHRLWHYSDSKRYAARIALFKPTGQITAKILRCVETNQGVRFESFSDFSSRGALSSEDIDFLTSNAAIYFPIQPDSPTNAVVIELPQARIVSLKNGFVTWKKPKNGE